MNTLQQILEDQFLFKKIIVPLPERNDRGKVIPNRFVDCMGQCTFIGSNPIMGWDLQVTVDGMPLPVKHVNDICIYTPKRFR